MDSHVKRKCGDLCLDTTEERNRLIEYVYPKLREYCWKKYQIQFQVNIPKVECHVVFSKTRISIPICVGAFHRILTKQLIYVYKNLTHVVDCLWQRIVL